MSAAEAASGGVTWTYAPMIDVSRDPRWGRVAEGFGEDTLLNAVFGAAKVRGYQGSDLADPGSILACAKHYVAYGAAEGGRDYNTVDVSAYRLRNVYLEPFRAAVEAGAATVMASFNTVAGRPVHAPRESADRRPQGGVGLRRRRRRGRRRRGQPRSPHGIAEDLHDALGQSLSAGPGRGDGRQRRRRRTGPRR